MVFLYNMSNPSTFVDGFTQSDFTEALSPDQHQETSAFLSTFSPSSHQVGTVNAAAATATATHATATSNTDEQSMACDVVPLSNQKKQKKYLPDHTVLPSDFRARGGILGMETSCDWTFEPRKKGKNEYW